ncbi:sarcosine oxidase subunit delta [Abyssibius alkaniclasticus]|uniref:sarcosine oxidase subunit delta n=1 Tax=Abyssibius alkaniclasticus TaxID=2881234 RepID=UPI0023632CFE|nr:sarcosine oxidase subunit delta [Abyssibius alkaniclasticus]UPH71023.1 sarcosine oxidase subunit delta [Abyssibius alkaniclasticus]
MQLNCPHCGARDLREFSYLGSAKLIARPDPADQAAMVDYVHYRDNPAGANAELWQHDTGCRAWLHVLRNTLTHEVLRVELARDTALEAGR